MRNRYKDENLKEKGGTYLRADYISSLDFLVTIEKKDSLFLNKVDLRQFPTVYGRVCWTLAYDLSLIATGRFLVAVGLSSTGLFILLWNPWLIYIIVLCALFNDYYLPMNRNGVVAH